MTTNNKFSFKRCSNTFVWFAAVNKKKLIQQISGFAIFSMILGLLTFWTRTKPDNGIYIATLFIGTAVVTANFLSAINKKSICQQFLSLPASNLEKYIAAIALLITKLIAIYIAVIFGDIMRGVIQYIIQGREFEIMFIDTNTYINTREPAYYRSAMNGLIISYLCLFFNFYITSGTTFRKHPFLIGSILGSILTIIYVKIISFLLEPNAVFIGAKIDEVSETYIVDNLVYYTIAILSILAVVCIWMSYRNFKKLMLNPQNSLLPK